jgi:hypothetical protein
MVSQKVFSNEKIHISLSHSPEIKTGTGQDLGLTIRYLLFDDNAIFGYRVIQLMKSAKHKQTALPQSAKITYV